MRLYDLGATRGRGLHVRSGKCVWVIGSRVCVLAPGRREAAARNQADTQTLNPTHKTRLSDWSTGTRSRSLRNEQGEHWSPREGEQARVTRSYVRGCVAGSHTQNRDCVRRASPPCSISSRSLCSDLPHSHLCVGEVGKPVLPERAPTHAALYVWGEEARLA